MRDNYPNPSSSERSNWSEPSLPRWPSCLLIALIVVVFGQTVTFDFLQRDDYRIVVRHVGRTGGLTDRGLHWALTSLEDGWMTPVARLSILLDGTLYGVSPAGFHLTNLVIHAVTTLLLFEFLFRTTRGLLPSAFASAIFAVHPLHVEPVAWVSGRWELLCGCFWIIGMGAYASYVTRPSLLRALMVLIAYGCALLSKPIALTFPFALLLLDYWPLCRIGKNAEPTQPPSHGTVSWWQAVREKLPLFFMMSIMLAITLSAKLARFDAPRTPLSQSVPTAVQVYMTYLRRFLWPTDLSSFYPHPASLGEEISSTSLLMSSCLLVGISLIALHQYRHRHLLVGWLWFLGVLFPTVGFINLGSIQADRYMYLPLVGLTIIACWSVPRLLATTPSRTVALAPIAVVAILALSLRSYQLVASWKNNGTFYQHAIATNPRDYKAWQGQGDLAMRDGDYQRATTCFMTAETLSPNPDGWNHFGMAKAALGAKQFHVAEDHLKVALDRNEQAPHLHNLLANVYLEQDRPRAAAEAFTSMIRLAPRNPDAHRWYGDYCFSTSRYELALEHYAQLAHLDPLDEQVVAKMGATYEQLGRLQEAADLYEEHFQSFPWRSNVGLALAWLLASRPQATFHDPVRAVEILEGMRDQTRDSVELLGHLGVAYAAAGRFEDAERITREALASLSANDDQRAVLTERIQRFASAKPWLEPVLSDPDT